eukprot:TRINITY_DN11639_c0_g1_i2.p1 TRINITY_DN11639_c0_g1~~TRINITY_DN11639_c0_g1_i2.p1  ORF type:complete len:792 (-),score=297.70 TRINITY_DN11639_c0_g1_i2:131-2434(-)
MPVFSKPVCLAGALLSASHVDSVRQMTMDKVVVQPHVPSALMEESSMAGAVIAAGGTQLIEPCRGGIKERWSSASSHDEIMQLLRDKHIWEAMDQYISTASSNVAKQERIIADKQKEKASAAGKGSAQAVASTHELKEVLLQSCKEALNVELESADEEDMLEILRGIKKNEALDESALKSMADNYMLSNGGEGAIQTLEDCVIFGLGSRLTYDDTAGKKMQKLAVAGFKKLGDKTLDDGMVETCTRLLDCESVEIIEDSGLEMLGGCEDVQPKASDLCANIKSSTASAHGNNENKIKMEVSGIDLEIKKEEATKVEYEDMLQSCKDMKVEFEVKKRELEAFKQESDGLLQETQGFDTRLHELNTLLASLRAKLEDQTGKQVQLEAAAKGSSEAVASLIKQIADVNRRIQEASTQLQQTKTKLGQVEEQHKVVTSAQKTSMEMTELIKRMKDQIRELVKQSISEPLRALDAMLPKDIFPDVQSLREPLDASAQGVVAECKLQSEKLAKITIDRNAGRIQFPEDTSHIFKINYNSSSTLTAEVQNFEAAKPGRQAKGLVDICSDSVSSQESATATVDKILAKIKAMQAVPKGGLQKVHSFMKRIWDAVEQDWDVLQYLPKDQGKSAGGPQEPFSAKFASSDVMKRYKDLARVQLQADQASESMLEGLKALARMIAELQETQQSLEGTLRELRSTLEKLEKQLAAAKLQNAKDQEAARLGREAIKATRDRIAETEKARASVLKKLDELRAAVEEYEAKVVAAHQTGLLKA